MRSLIAAMILCAMAMAAFAQSIGGMDGIGPRIGGAGGGSGPPPPTGCTNQLVLDYSNSCALIAQGWGQ